MPIQAIAEKDEESDRVLLVLQESEESMTDSEKEKWLSRFERNMVPANIYDDEQVAPI